ncbi:glutamate racemase [Lactobacillus sp. ESL0236]|uniref:glutamate racemase n=1 Tax=unclassified Lactobacillus TaxID=2620435 RepID=UPI000EFD6FCD|nr:MULTISPECIES: glutamate racemase [unclassified Lactobacillus]RMC41302.1 glutamate racemase [Lactobacillus sp. ESL0237]RMC45171.1 glutamate racemase [Lactobacillus sp. ESL0234]RMC46004.1 glutamate racemase [Lactobacillus sp. ESL0236]
MDKRPIGLLDSGVGGLTVVKKVIKKMPNENIIFVGDNAHIPYGNKSQAEIISLTLASVNFLLSKNVKVIIFACNTATAVAMDIIQKQISPKIIGVIPAGAKCAINASQNQKIAVVATQMTTNLHAYQKEITKYAPKIEVTEVAAPQLVPLIENNASHSEYDKALSEILLPLQAVDFDTLILGCTHYPIIRSEFERQVGSHVQVIDPADQVAQYTYNLLKKEHLLNANLAVAQHEFYTTGKVEKVNELGRLVLNDSNFQAQQI